MILNILSYLIVANRLADFFHTLEAQWYGDNLKGLADGAENLSATDICSIPYDKE